MAWQRLRSDAGRPGEPSSLFPAGSEIVNGGTLNLGTSCYGASPNPPCGLTVASENPVYIEGDFNAPNNGTWTGASVAASVAADGVTLLSDGWNDINSFISPYSSNARPGAQTAYRVALIAGKGIPFPQPSTENPKTTGPMAACTTFHATWENMESAGEDGWGLPGA